jgi:dihydrofolate synthase / folylpolyglutamate synthase
MFTNNLSEWLAYLEQHYIYIHGGTVDGLPRLRNIAKKINLDSIPTTVITIGGTNGKGSCVVYLESILLAAGYKVGAYISPHILHFNERIRLNGQDVDDERLIEAFSKVDAVCKDSEITYFEFTTLAAFYLFKNTPLDIVLLEVGLGGRLDAVNIVNPDISVITTISLDHTEQLGDTREKIGYEKAGIMRPNHPCVCGDLNPPHSIIEYAKDIGANLYCLNKDFIYSKSDKDWSFTFQIKKLINLPIPKLSLQDASTALMAITLLPSSFKITEIAIKNGLVNARILGRFQTISNNPLIIVDVAHNPESAAFLAEQLASKPIKGKTLAVVGILKDKDIKNILYPMLTQVNEWFVGGLQQDTARGAHAEEVLKNLELLNVKLCYNCENISEAYHKAVLRCSSEDRIIVFGSFYSVANILKEEKKKWK